MKAEPLKVSEDGPGYSRCAAEEATHVRLNMPGPVPTRIIPVRVDKGPQWKWNGCVDKPTLTPSILTTAELKKGKIVCHSFVTDGKVKFLNDCTHSFAGKITDLLDID